MGEPPAMSLNGLKLCESQEIKRLKTLDLLSTTRPSGGTLPAPSTAGPTDRDLPHQRADDLLELHLHPRSGGATQPGS
jgi:hypothetical protein